MDKTKLLLKHDEITALNHYIQSHSSAFFQLHQISHVSIQEIKDFIFLYSFNSKTNIKESNLTKYANAQNNQNIQNIHDCHPIQKGIIINRTNLKSLPTIVSFDTAKGFDQIQESELHINTPVLILHDSLDKEWHFVLSFTYAGWILKKDVAYISDKEFDRFQFDDFGIILTPHLKIENVVLEMGVKLFSCRNHKEKTYLIPFKNTDGYISEKEVFLSEKDIHPDYLPLTLDHFKKQAFQYLNTRYSWGGKDEGIDCSGFVVNICKTFGINLPRNASSQQTCFPHIQYLFGNAQEKLSQIKNMEPALLYQKGHVMIYLGMKENQPFIIHANATNMKVSCDILDTSSLILQKIDRVISLKDQIFNR